MSPWRSVKFSGLAKRLLFVAILNLPAVLAGARVERTQTALPPSHLTDIHCHVAGIGAGDSGCFVSERLRHSWRFRIYLRSFGVTESELSRDGDRAVPDRISQRLAGSCFVDKAVLLALDGVVGFNGTLDKSRTEVYVPNEFVAEAAASHSNLLFGASINPWRTDALERLTWAKEHGAVLVKWIPSVMQIDPSDKRLISFYRKMVELDLPLLTHAGKERAFSSSTDALCDPEKLRLPLDMGVTVIAAHVASTGRYNGQRSSERLAKMMPEYSNLYSDISSLTQLNKLRFAREALSTPEFAGKLIYGSDFPLINTALVSPWYYAFRLSPRKLFAITKEKNPWDADVELKHALGLFSEKMICKKSFGASGFAGLNWDSRQHVPAVSTRFSAGRTSAAEHSDRQWEAARDPFLPVVPGAP